MNIKKIFINLSVILGLLFSASPAFAHVVVKPSEAGSAAFQTFTVGVPNEKDVPTTGVRLVIPEGLKYVTPNVKAGWAVDVKKSEIIWTGGSIPSGQRDEFLFSAQVPAEETSLQWRAYQTYEDGEVVAWDQEPSKNHDDHDTKPYSETKVVNDLAKATNASTKTASASSNDISTMLSLVAVILSAGALYFSTRKKK